MKYCPFGRERCARRGSDVEEKGDSALLPAVARSTNDAAPIQHQEGAANDMKRTVDPNRHPNYLPSSAAIEAHVKHQRKQRRQNNARQRRVVAADDNDTQNQATKRHAALLHKHRGDSIPSMSSIITDTPSLADTKRRKEAQREAQQSRGCYSRVKLSGCDGGSDSPTCSRLNWLTQPSMWRPMTQASFIKDLDGIIFVRKIDRKSTKGVC